MGYIFTFRIGYHQVDPERNLSLSSLIDLFQDCGGFHGTDCGYSNKQLSEVRQAWIVSSWQILIHDMPLLDDYVTLETYPFRFRYCMADRHFILRSPEGHEYARANSIWVLMNMDHYAPVKISREMQEAYGECEDQTGGYDFGDRKILAPADMIKRDPVRVESYMTDTNGHMNNKEYVRIAGSIFPNDIGCNFFRAEYTKQAMAGDVMIPFVGSGDGKTSVSFMNEQNEQLFICEWSKR